MCARAFDAKDCCLFLDVDGTLLDIAPTPDAVRVDPALRRLLRDLRRVLGGAVALVSGRSLATLDRLFAPDRWPAAGLHGLERRDASGRLEIRAADSDRLGPARDAMARLAAATPGVHVEDKEHALALHYRAAPREAPRLSAAMSTIARDLAPGYEVLPGKAVFELRPASVSKGMAIESFIEESPFRGRRPVFIGDDVTDLDGFAAVERAGGVSIAVGDQLPALCRVASPAAVRRLLGDLAAGRPVMP